MKQIVPNVVFVTQYIFSSYMVFVKYFLDKKQTAIRDPLYETCVKMVHISCNDMNRYTKK